MEFIEKKNEVMIVYMTKYLDNFIHDKEWIEFAFPSQTIYVKE